MARRMQMAAEDGQKMSEECQKITQKVMRAFSHGLVGESS